MNTVKIGSRLVGEGEPTYIVAEIGINHNGFVSHAKEMIDIAKQAGCDAVKFQKRTVTTVYSEAELAKPRSVPASVVENAIKRGVLQEEALRRLTNSIENTTNGDLKNALELSAAEYNDISDHAECLNISWFASPWDEESVEFLEHYNPPCYKIASACLTDRELLRVVKNTGRPIILSTGMSTVHQIDKAVEELGTENLVLMHTVSKYPCEREELNLNCILTLKDRYDVPVGYSGHERGTTMSVCAVALGACMIERHITIHRDMWGSDQSASLEPAGLKVMVNNIRDFEKALGSGDKSLLSCEVEVQKKLRRKDTLFD